jgi:hypothetical protein
LPDDPQPLLVERRVETGDSVHTDRVTADGRRWTSGNVDAQFADGKWTFGAREPGWESAGTLTPDQLAALRDALAGSGFFETAPEYHPDVPVIHASSEVWTAELDGRHHTTTLYGRGTTKVPAIEQLDRALTAATPPSREHVDGASDDEREQGERDG